MLLKSTLTQVEQECRSAKVQVNELQKKLHTLEEELEHMKQASEKHHHHHHSSNAVSKGGVAGSPPHSLQNFLQQPMYSSSSSPAASTDQYRSDADFGYDKSVSGLQSKLLELEEKYEMQVIRHEQLTHEMNQLRQQQQPAPSNISNSSRVHGILSEHHHQHVPYSSSADVSTTSIYAKDGDKVTFSQMETKVTSDRCGVGSKSTTSRNSSFQVFVARYNYDPVHHSPNENPEAELTLTAGDYIFIYGDLDEDGFYDGELMDGRCGLVPSNFIRKVPDKDLDDFHSSFALRETDECTNASSMNSSIESSGLYNNRLFTSSFTDSDFQMVHNNKSSADDEQQQLNLDDIQEVEEEDLISATTTTDIKVTDHSDPSTLDVPYPVGLVVERQLLNSLLISWSPPPPLPPPPPPPYPPLPPHPHPSTMGIAQLPIQSYSVYLDGLLKASMRANDRTKALLEKVDLNRSHQISVRAVTSQGQSKDQQCIITVGRGVSPKPSDFQVTNVTSTSAVVSWTPSNSNWEHVLLVNNRHRTIVKPGGYRCIITGLQSDLRASVSVQPNIEAESHFIASAKVSLSFKTLPSEIPDAPLEVQVEPGPKQGTLLIMWLPVKPDGKPPNSAVTGYSVYVDGRRVKDLPSPTGDHVLLECEDFSSIQSPRQITIRATTATKESDDSAPISLTPQLLSEVKAADPVKTFLSQSHQQQQQQTTFANGPEAQGSLTAARQSQLQVAMSPTCPAQQWNSPVGAATVDASVVDGDWSTTQGAAESSRLIKVAGVGPGGSLESGFSAQQLSPMEMRFGAVERNEGGYSGADFHLENNISSVNAGGTIGRGNLPPGVVAPTQGGTLPLIEVTKENSGSFSDSSFDVDLDETLKRTTRNANSSNANVNRHTPPGDVVHKSSHGGRITDRQRSQQHSGSFSGNSIEETAMMNNNYEKDDSQKIGTSHRTSGRMKPLGKSRIFIALFNYDPATMSPNPDGIEEELPFKEGQLIKIIRDKDTDGFYVGEAGGLRGLVPSNMISEVDDPAIIASQMMHDPNFNRSLDGAGASVPPDAGTSSVRFNTAPSAPKHKHSKQAHKVQHLDSTEPSAHRVSRLSRYMVALCSYNPPHDSSQVNSEVELSFKAGDTIVVFGEPDKDGLLYGERDGRRGLFPASFLRDFTPADNPQTSTEKRSRHGSGHVNREPDEQQGQQGQRHHQSVGRSHTTEKPIKSSSHHRHHTRDETPAQNSVGVERPPPPATTKVKGIEHNAVQTRNHERSFINNDGQRAIHRQQ